MGLRINQNIAAMNAYRNLTVSENQMSKSLEKLSSGFRINRAADDAAGLVISENLRSQVSGLKVAVRNAQDGISVVQTAEGALTEVHSMLQRVRDLFVQAANGSNGTTSNAAIQSEVTELGSAIKDIVDRTKFNGQSLLDGTNASMKFQVGANDGDTLSVALTNLKTLTGYTGFTVGTNTIADVDSDINAVSSFRGSLGASQNRLEHTISNLGVSVENLAASESRIRDTDMAEEMVSYTRSNILQQAGTSMLAQANSSPQSVLQLLRG